MSQIKLVVDSYLVSRGRAAFLWADCSQWATDIMGFAADDHNPYVMIYMDEWVKNSSATVRANLNIVAVDNIASRGYSVISGILSYYHDGLLPERYPSNPRTAAEPDTVAPPASSEPTGSRMSDEQLTLARARQIAGERGLDWHELTAEVKNAGALSEASIGACEAAGLSGPLVREFIARNRDYFSAR